MFRDGQYLEVIKASDHCLATAVVTVQEKTIEIKKKKVSTNKWLDLEDWAAVYRILEKALLRNSKNEGYRREYKRCERKKSTRKLEVAYTLEPPDYTKDSISLPTIRVNISAAKRVSRKPVSTSEISDSKKEKSSTKTDLYNKKGKEIVEIIKHQSPVLEEYVPDAPNAKKLYSDLKYVPSKKSTLENLHLPLDEYTPTPSDDKTVLEFTQYIPSPSKASNSCYKPYEPRGSIITLSNTLEEYVPSSKTDLLANEYQPDFTSKSMTFDNSYIPSSKTISLNNASSSKSVQKNYKVRSQKDELYRKGVRMRKEKTHLLAQS